MKKTTFAIIIVIIVCSLITRQEQSIRVAIVPFDGTSAMENLSLSATNSLTQLLSNNKSIAIRPPYVIQGYISLLEKVQAGYEEPATLKGKTQSLQVDYLVVGSIGKILDRYEVDARIVDVQSWKIVSSCGVQTDSAIRGVGDANYFSSLSGATVQQYLKQTKENPTVGIQELREYCKNPPNALYCSTFI